MNDEPISVLIVDDESLTRTRIRQLLHEAGDFSVISEARNGEQALVAAVQHRPDVIFLDIQMPGMNGLEVLEALESIRRSDAGPEVVFVTAYDRYALRAFDVNAADYLLKPVDAERFESSLDRLRARFRGPVGKRFAAGATPRMSALAAELPVERRYLTRFVIPGRSGVLVVPAAEVELLRAADNYVEVATAARVHLLRARLSELATRLDPHQFVRIHRSCIVAGAHVRGLRRGSHGEFVVRLASGRQTRASRTYRGAVRGLLRDFDAVQE